MSDSLRLHGLGPTSLLCPWDFPGKGTGVGCHFLLQRIFPTQGANPGLPYCRHTLYRLSHQGSLSLNNRNRDWINCLQRLRDIVIRRQEMRKLPIRCVAFDVMSTKEAEIPCTHASCLTKECRVAAF